jgi:mono/diheme cytochrome c family protein
MVRQAVASPPAVTVVPTVGPNASQRVSYHVDVQPILTSECGSCHGGQGGFWVDSYELVLRGGNSGAVVVPGKPNASELYLRITGKATPAMPLNNPPLSQPEITAIRDWIAEGAPKN